MRRIALLSAVLLAAGCASLRWSGSPPPDSRAGDALHPAPPPPGPELEAPALSTTAARRPLPAASLPEPSAVKLETAAFYSDLGPDELDISSYPLQQRTNYRVYTQACARCHGLSRSLYAPHTSGPWLDFYLTSMRVRGGLAGRGLTKEEVRAVRDFLRYDARERKAADAAAFQAQLEQLRSRFDALLAERMRRLQRNPPVLPRSSRP